MLSGSGGYESSESGAASRASTPDPSFRPPPSRPVASLFVPQQPVQPQQPMQPQQPLQPQQPMQPQQPVVVAVARGAFLSEPPQQPPSTMTGAATITAAAAAPVEPRRHQLQSASASAHMHNLMLMQQQQQHQHQQPMQPAVAVNNNNNNNNNTLLSGGALAASSPSTNALSNNGGAAAAAAPTTTPFVPLQPAVTGGPSVLQLVPLRSSSSSIPRAGAAAAAAAAASVSSSRAGSAASSRTNSVDNVPPPPETASMQRERAVEQPQQQQQQQSLLAQQQQRSMPLNALQQRSVSESAVATTDTAGAPSARSYSVIINNDPVATSAALQQHQRIRQLVEEREQLLQMHEDAMHKASLELQSTKSALAQSGETVAAMQRRLDAALEAERVLASENDRLMLLAKEHASRARTVSGTVATFQDVQNTLYINCVKGRFEISVMFVEGLLDLALHDKRLVQQESRYFQRAHQRTDQLLIESEGLREEMQAAMAAAEDAAARQRDLAQRTIEELQRELVMAQQQPQPQTQTGGSGGDVRAGSVSGGNKRGSSIVIVGATATGRTASDALPANTNNNNHNNNNNNKSGSPPTNLRGASSTQLRSATAPNDPEATSRRLQEELADALQAKEALQRQHAQMQRRLRELESEMAQVYAEGKRVHELMKAEAAEARAAAARSTNDEVARAKKAATQFHSQLLTRIENLEGQLAERTQACVLAQQQVNHLTEVLEDACEVGAVPLLKTAGNHGFVKMTVAKRKLPVQQQQQQQQQQQWTPASHNDQQHQASMMIPYLASIEASGGAVLGARSGAGTAAAGTSSTSPVRPSWNTSRKISSALNTTPASPTQQQQTCVVVSGGGSVQKQRQRQMIEQMQNRQSAAEMQERQLFAAAVGGGGGAVVAAGGKYTAGMLPASMLPAWVNQRQVVANTHAVHQHQHHHQDVAESGDDDFEDDNTGRGD